MAMDSQSDSLQNWVCVNEIERGFKIAMLDQRNTKKSQAGKCRIIQFGDSFTTERVYSIEDFSKFPDTVESLQTQELGRVLIVLEDLGLDWIEALHANFNVPYNVFAEHWADPEYHTSGKMRTPLGEDVQDHYILNYDQQHPIGISQHKRGLLYRLNCSATRSLDFSISENEVENESNHPRYTSQQLISYWGKTRAPKELGGWFALLLVDPPIDFTQSKTAIYGVKNEGNHTSQSSPVTIVHRTTGVDSLPRLSNSIQPLPRPEVPCGIFDEIVSVSRENITHEPSSAALASRRLVLARTSLAFEAAFSAVYSLTVASTAGIKVDDTKDEMASLDFETLGNRAWRSEWEGKRFTELWEQRENLELLRYRLHKNIQIIESLTPDSHEEAWGERGEYNLQMYSPDNLEKIWRAFCKQQRIDLKEWQGLDRTADFVNQAVVRTTESYLQTVAARESQLANFQARSVGRLSKMATIFVPVSLCAAIFSMGGNFAAGNSRFWIFWVISLPIAILLILWMFGQTSWHSMKKVDGKVRSKIQESMVRGRRLKSKSDVAQLAPVPEEAPQRKSRKVGQVFGTGAGKRRDSDEKARGGEDMVPPVGIRGDMIIEMSPA